MKKRAIAILIIITLMFSVSGVRLFYLTNLQSDHTAASQSSVRVTLSQPRGTIYDRNLLPITNAQEKYIAAVAPTSQAVAEISRKLSPEAASEALLRLKQGNPIALEVPADFSAEGAYVFKTFARYSEVQTAPHIVGYLNSGGHGVFGIEQAYDDELYRKESLSVVYTTDARGRVLTGIKPDIIGEDAGDKSGISLTIDTKIQKIAETAAKNNLKAGAVVVLEADTGKIRAACSVPDFSPVDIAKSLAAENSPLINRAFSTYNVGSVFKLCVASAALESGVPESFTYHCNGKIKLKNNTFNCHEENGHGSIDMRGGLCVSCNPYFVNLGIRTGAENIYNMCRSLKFGDQLTVAKNMSAEKSVLPALWKLKEQPAALANFSFGQGELMLTPLDIASLVCAIANGGYYCAPTLVEGTVTADKKLKKTAQSSPVRIMSVNTAQQMSSMMIDVIEKGTGKPGKPAIGGAGGKTATAETGWVREGRTVNQAWFGGFYPAENPKYAIVVLGEDGVSGSVTAAPVFKQICDGLAKMY